MSENNFKILGIEHIGVATNNNLLNNFFKNILGITDIYVEEVTSLVVAEFQVSYNTAVLSLVNSAKGDMLAEIETSAFVLEGIPGLLQVNFTTLEHTGFTGSGSVLHLKFKGTSSDSVSIALQNPVFKDIDGNDFAQDIGIRHGEVVIE